jgi:hypothetical protein
MQFRKNQDYRCEQSGAAPTGQPERRHLRRIAVCLVAIAALAHVAGSGQLSPGAPPHWGSPGNSPDANAQMEMRQQQAGKQNFDAINAERNKQIADESAKLLKLAADLKAEVDKTNKDTLSLTVIRKAEAIEKLARDVKEKMKLSVGSY